MSRGSWVLALSLAVVSAPSLAHADDAACIDANEKSISLRRDGKLKDALAILAACTDPSCPDDVKDACAKRIAKVNEALPTIVFAAKNGSGEDVTDVTVTMDGAPLLTTLDGRPITLDPGSHAFVFTAKGQPAVERTMVIHEGEKNRQELVRVGPEPAKLPPPPPPPPPSNAWSTQKIAGVVVAGVGVVGLGLGATFGLIAMGDQSSEQKHCSASSCPDRGTANSDYDNATRDATISTVSFVAGGVLVAGGAALFFLAKPPEQKTDAPKTATVTRVKGLQLVPAVDAKNRGLFLRGEF